STLSLLIALPLLGLSYLGRGYVVTASLAPLLLGLLQILLYADRKIYALFHFHLNGLVVNVLTTPGGWESMHVRLLELVAVIAAAAGFLVAEYALYLGLARRCASAGAAASGRPWALLVGVVLALAALERVTYAISDVANLDDVTRSARLVPLYQPFTVRHLIRRYTHIALDPGPTLVHGTESRGLRYPRNPLRFGEPARRPTTARIVLDSWRADTFSPDNTPELWRLGERSQVFRHHVSGGNSTRNGIFTMFYGLYGSYWQHVLTEGAGPVLLQRLKELDYRIKIMSSSSL